MPVDIRPIQLRRGKEEDYKPNKMKAGELAVFTDTRKLNIAFAPGVSKEVALTEQVEALSNSVDTRFQTATQNISASEQDIVELQNGQRQTLNLLNGKIDEAILSEDRKYLTLKANGSVVAELGPFAGEGGGGGGGGDSTTVTTMTMDNLAGWLAKTVSKGVELSVSCEWSSTLGGIPTGNGVLKVFVDGATRQTRNVAQGEFSVDLTRYLNPGTRSIRLNVTDAYGNSRNVIYTVTVEDYSIRSSFDVSQPVSGAFLFTYIPSGLAVKTVHFSLDGVELETDTVETSGRQQSKSIPAKPHGAHTLDVWFTVDMDGDSVNSNVLHYEYMSVGSSNTPIITSQWNKTEISQFEANNIDFRVYDPLNISTTVELYDGATKVNTLTEVDRNEHVWNYRPMDYGSKTLKIKCGNTEKTFSITVTESEYDIGAVTEGLQLHLTAQGRNNAEEHPEAWSYGNISATLTDFNFVSDGWQTDEDGASVLRISGNARVTIPFKIFQSDFRNTGKTIELEFATRDVMSYDTPIISCWSGSTGNERGIRATSQMVVLKSEKASSTQQFKENEHVRISYVIEKDSDHRIIYCYVNGIISGAVVYPANDDFSQLSAVNMSIGTNDSTVDVYNIRVYDHALTKEQILRNFTADAQDSKTMMERYERNDIFDGQGNIIIEKLPKNLPYMIISCPQLPQEKGDKKTCTVQYVDPVNSAKSFTAENVQIDVQGTSSQYYPRKNYKLKYKNGFTNGSGQTVAKYQLSDDCLPTNVFCMKADFASSEGANNVELVRLYEEACPYRTPAQQTDDLVRQGIDGLPCVIFYNDGQSTQFIGKYNFNLDKGSEECFGFVSGDESWEIKTHASDRVLWKSDDFESMGVDDKGNPIPAWLNDFEARYPDTDPAYTDPTQLKAFASWIKQTDTEAATGNALDSSVTYDGTTYTADTAEYRLAKFKAEIGNYVETDSMLFYYLFTELFLMVDSRSKNMFPSFMGSEVIGA